MQSCLLNIPMCFSCSLDSCSIFNLRTYVECLTWCSMRKAALWSTHFASTLPFPPQCGWLRNRSCFGSRECLWAWRVWLELSEISSLVLCFRRSVSRTFSTNSFSCCVLLILFLTRFLCSSIPWRRPSDSSRTVLPSTWFFGQSLSILCKTLLIQHHCASPWLLLLKGKSQIVFKVSTIQFFA